ncbi:GAF domain-containing SpoIIE family protein phosphatase [Actinoplanes sp. NBRC 103695]|uniref:PP2C family protein-serine/threonine phosphatase n=1 Tax=Actinoplanes sp. NBRC 103695 TaxID=3032202 RepID=UPI0024A56A57|nr:GAF domain-containing SpoIIE family protein phosphatase [Actinoplanes sp. NBRC 103695]GLY94047.1 cyclic diguanylate phosphodiesterase [Actinoplanes sp. NBRC 103695]
MTEGLRDGERLRRIEAVTDAALSQLDSPDLLEELLDRVIDLLAADTAAVLLLDAHAGQLVTTAARGLEDEVRQGFRLAIGSGFAGRVADARKPVIVTDVASSDVVSPVLRRKGITSLLGVPMFFGGDVIGVLHVGTFHTREFTADDAQLLQIAADRAAVAWRDRSVQDDRTAAAALQRSLLPARLPPVPGLELAARYVPGHHLDIGGDWYDVFALPTGWLGVVIGDVSGHGLASAVVMGRVRSALRSYALISDQPAEVLTHLDRKINHFEAGSLTTALYAMISPDRGTVRLSSAGHFAPIIAGPGEPARHIGMPIDPPLGIRRLQRARRGATVELPVGAVLVCYTDGLIERRGELIDEGLRRLRGHVTPASADLTCAAAMAEATAEPLTDDAAVLALRRTQ